MILEINPYKNVRDYVYHTIKKMIFTLKFLPGSRLSEVKVSEILETSRTPVREAFIRLAEEGLMGILPQRGTIVSLINRDHVEEGRFIRRALEEQVMKLVMTQYREETQIVCKKILQEHELVSDNDYEQQSYYDSLFHHEIYRLVGMERTWNMIEKMNIDYYRMQYLVLIDYIKNESVLADHYAILKSITEGNVEEVVQLSFSHLARWDHEKDQVMAHFPSYFQHNHKDDKNFL